jgi:hypothetical protein
MSQFTVESPGCNGLRPLSNKEFLMTRGPAPAEDRERSRFGLRLTESERDRIIADWIDDQINRGFDVSQQVKDILYQLITGRSVINNQPLGIYTIGRPEEDNGKKN